MVTNGTTFNTKTIHVSEQWTVFFTLDSYCQNFPMLAWLYRKLVLIVLIDTSVCLMQLIPLGNNNIGVAQRNPGPGDSDRTRHNTSSQQSFFDFPYISGI